jgi:sterol desaturase/sphingolipid hydroxylase (fatty acid hydroxylase superfamily)
MTLPLIAFIVFIRHTSTEVFQSLLFLTGWCTWTFVEYILHRFWMHDKDSDSSMAQTHHYHHTHPTEIIVTNVHRALMIVFLIALVFVAACLNDYFTFLVGFCFGIVGYFWMHQFLHLKIGQKVFKRLVRYHIYHHCKYPSTCFGISVPWWDDLFKTVPASPKITQRIIDFYFKGHEKEDHSLLAPAMAVKKSKIKNCSHNCKGCDAGVDNCSAG